MLFRRALAAQFGRAKSSLVVQHFDDMPSPKGLPFVGTTLAILAQGSTPQLHRYVDRRHRQLGPVFRERLGPVSAVFVSDADAIRAVFAQEGKHPMHLLPEAWVTYNRLYGCSRGLFFMDGQDWWHHRRIMNRLLLRGDLKWIEEACECVSDGLVGRLQGHFGDLEGALYRWSLDVIVAVLLGAKTYARLSHRLEGQTAALAQVVHLVFQTSAKLALIPASFAAKFRIPRWTRFVRSVDDALKGAIALVDGLVTELGPDSDGLLPRLLQEDIEPENVRRIIVDLVLAAGDTTAYALEWMLYAVGRRAELQEELRADHEMAKFVFKETLRLYPVAPFLTRILPEDSVLCGYGLPKGTLVVMSIYTSGRDGRYFKNPDSFEPRRWDREHNKDYNVGMQKATLPFAMGLRACVGRKIAETQLHMALLKIVNNFQVEVGNRKEVEIALKMVAVPSEPIKLTFKKL